MSKSKWKHVLIPIDTHEEIDLYCDTMNEQYPSSRLSIRSLTAGWLNDGIKRDLFQMHDIIKPSFNGEKDLTREQKWKHVNVIDTLNDKLDKYVKDLKKRNPEVKKKINKSVVTNQLCQKGMKRPLKVEVLLLKSAEQAYKD